MPAQSQVAGNRPDAASLIRPRMPELDTLRGLAVLGVVFLHGFYWPYSGLSFGKWATRFLLLTQPGWLGVNLFFVLSGFLITGILLDSKNKPNFYPRFYTRRALRILPAYYLLLVLLLLLHSSSPAFVGLSFLYLANVTNFFGVACSYGPLWSLAVEEHFYIIWPLIVRNVTNRMLAWASVLIVVFVPVARLIAFSRGDRFGLDWYTWFVADGLALGAVLAIVLRHGIARIRAMQLCGTLLGCSFLAAAAGAPFGIETRNRLLGAGFQLSVVNLFFAGLLLAFLLAGSGSSKKYVNLRALQFFGYISYGLYLDHLLAFRMYDRLCRNYCPNLLPSSGHFELALLRFTVAGGAAIGIAYLSRRFFEERFLRLKESLSWDRSAESTTVVANPSTQAA